MQKVIVIDPSKCTGCRACEMACSLYHEGACGPTLSRIRVVKWELEGIDVPLLCQQCSDAPCMSVCPTGALVRDGTTGAVTLLEERCIGCRMCSLACPFGAVTFDARGEKPVPLRCDLCGGDPQCVRFCETKALQFVRREQLGEEKRERTARLLVEPETRFRETGEGVTS